MNRTFDSIRICFAMLLALLLTAALFTALRSLTDVEFVPDVIEGREIKFSRVLVDTDSPRKDVITKPELKLPPVIDLPPLIGPPADPLDRRVIPIAPPTDALPTPAAAGYGAGSDRDVTPIVRINPIYPNRAAMNGTEGWVHVRFNISPTGAVTGATVVDSNPATVFDKAALDAITRWRYNPQVMDGVAVERRGVETMLRFDLPDE